MNGANSNNPPPEPIYVFKADIDGGCTSAQFYSSASKGDPYLVVGTSGGELLRYNLLTKKCDTVKIASKNALQFSNCKSVLSCGPLSISGTLWTHIRNDRVLLLRELFAGQLMVGTAAHPLSNLSLCPCDSWCDGEVQLLTIPTGNQLNRNVVSVFDVSEGSFSLGPQLIVSTDEQKRGALFTLKTIDRNHTLFGFESGHIAVWNQNRELSSQKLFDGAVLSMDYCSANSTVVCGSAQSPLVLAQIEHSTIVKVRSLEYPPTSAGAASISIRQDGRLFAVGFWDGTVRLFATKSLKMLARLEFHHESIFCVQFAKLVGDFDNMLSVCSKDGTVSLWNFYN